MKLLIISDTHGDLASIRRVDLSNPYMDFYLHAGDVEAPSSSIYPFAAVKGNCDGALSDYPLRRTVVTPLGKLLIQHYPIYRKSEMKELYDKGFRFFVHGHTHIKRYDCVEGVHCFCPGSLVYPRDDIDGSYLLLTILDTGFDYEFKKFIN